jgi:hypothetical protein
VSLILEALRKLEKEKATADRGFVVLGAASWPAPVARRWPVVAIGAAVLLAAGAVWWMTQRGPRDAPAVPAAQAVAERQPPPAPASVATTLAPAPATVPFVAPPVVAASRPRPITPSEAAAPAPARPATVAPAAPAATATTERRVQLQAITARDGRPLALVNDRLMGEGEEFEGIRIVAIRPDEVEVEVDGRRRVLKF